MIGYIIKTSILILLIGVLLFLIYDRTKTKYIKPSNPYVKLLPTSKLENNLNQCMSERSYEFQSMQDAAQGSLIIRFVNNTTYEQALEHIRSYDLTILHEYKTTLSGVSIQIPKGTEVEWACRLGIDPYVKSISFDRLSKLNESIDNAK